MKVILRSFSQMKVLKGSLQCTTKYLQAQKIFLLILKMWHVFRFAKQFFVITEFLIEDLLRLANENRFVFSARQRCGVL